MVSACQLDCNNCKISRKLEKKPGRKWFARALLCISDKVNAETNGERLRAAGACPCAKEIKNIVSDGERFGFGVMGVRHGREQVVFKDFSQALEQELPIYTSMDIFRRLSGMAMLFFKDQPQIMAHFGALSLGKMAKKAVIIAAGALGLVVLQLDKSGTLQTGIYQFLAESGLETAYKIFFGTVATAAFLWGASIENVSGIMAREAQHALYMIVDAAREAMKAKAEKGTAAENAT